MWGFAIMCTFSERIGMAHPDASCNCANWLATMTSGSEHNDRSLRCTARQINNP